MFKLNLKIALRNLYKHKLYTLINIGGLAIGLSCCMMFLLYVNYEWGYDKQFKHADRIFGVYKNYNSSNAIYTYSPNGGDALPMVLGPEAKASIPDVEAYSRVKKINDIVLSHDHESFKQDVLYVDQAFLDIFDYQFLKGTPATALSAPNALVITETLARKQFGTMDVIGKTLKWDNKELMTITAVIADLPANQSYQFDALASWAMYEKQSPFIKTAGWNGGFCNNILLLKDKNSFKSADKQLRQIFKRNESNTHSEAFLLPFSQGHLYNKFENGKLTGGRIDQVRLFILLAFCILFIACINYMNLSTARAERRAREVGVRKTLGSSRVSLAFQFFTESFCVSAVAMIFALIITEMAIPYFNNLLGIKMFIQYDVLHFLLPIVLLIIFTGFLAGSYPSFYLSSFIPVRVLKGFHHSGKATLPVRKVLVVMQFGFSICMIISAIVIYRQIDFIHNKPLGFEKDSLLELQRNGELESATKTALFKTELIKTGLITSATEFMGSFTNGGNNTTSFEWPGKQQNENILMNYRATGYDFIKTSGAALLAGRDFSKQFATDTAAVILNESTVKAMRLSNPIGTRIKWENNTFTVIGVVKDYNYESAVFKVTPTLYFYSVQNTNSLLLHLNPAVNLSESIKSIEAIARRINPAFPVEPRFISENMENKFKNEKLMGTLSNIFGGFAILISCLGLLGLALFMAEQRSKEISIRKILGANPADILILLNKDFVKLVLIANLIAFPAAYLFAFKWLQQFDYKIQLTAWPFLLALSLSLLIALLTISMQSFKVAKANPVDALKYE